MPPRVINTKKGMVCKVYESVPGLSPKHRSEVYLKTSPNIDVPPKDERKYIGIDVPGLHYSES